MTDPVDRPPPPSQAFPAAPPGHPPAYPSYPGYPGYTPYPQGYPPPMRNGLGTAALVAAVLALVTAWSVVGGVLLGGAAVLLGLLGYGRIRRHEANNAGVTMAGTVLGGLALMIGIVCAVLYTQLWKSSGAEDYVECMTKAGSDDTAQLECMNRFREHFEDRFGSDPLSGAP